MFYTGPDLSDVEKEEVIYNDDPSKKCEDWRQGRRIVELDVLAKGLKACEICGLPLQLQCQRNPYIWFRLTFESKSNHCVYGNCFIKY